MSQFWPAAPRAPINQTGSSSTVTSSASGSAGSSAWTTYTVLFPVAFPGVPQVFEVLIATGDIASPQVQVVTATGATFRVNKFASTSTPVPFSSWRATYLP